MALYLSKLNVNGQEYQIKDANAATAIELASKVGYGYYNSETSEIVFYDKEDTNGRTELFSIDATGFIKDGMVSNVAISKGNLVITFNTDAGKEPISIALTDIFNPANYYNKTEVDGKLDLKADASNVYTKSEADGKFLTEHQSLADYPTIETMNTALGQKANVSDIYTQTEINNKLAAKANSADLAKVATSGSYNDLSDRPVIPEGAVVDAALSDTSENPVQNKVVKGAIDEKVNKSDIIEFVVPENGSITVELFNKLYQSVANKQKVFVFDNYSAYTESRPLYAAATITIHDENNISISYIFGGKNGSQFKGTPILINIRAEKTQDEVALYKDYFIKDIYITTQQFNTTIEQAQQLINTKQDAISDLETIRSGAALGATALQSYTETDPVFAASAAHGITAQDITAWNAKSDFSGSYNDLTDKPTIPTQTRVSVTGDTLFITTAE